MLQPSDFREGLPVIIEGRQAVIVAADDAGIVAESVLPIGPRESRHAQWTIPASYVLAVVTYDGDRDFIRSGTVLCDDCGSRVRPETLASLPEHRCTEKRRARAEASR